MKRSAIEQEKKKHKEDRKNSVGRAIFVGLACIFQIAWFVLVLLRLSENYLWLSMVLRLLVTGSVLRIFGKHSNPTVKMSWIIFIMAVPVLGWVMYLLNDRSNFVNTMTRRFRQVDSILFPFLPDNQELLQELREANRGVANQMYFLKSSCGFPPYRNTDVCYFPEASEGMKAQKEALRRARHFIFMEYHAIEDREAFGELKDILIERARAGVEVRVFYDDVGSVGFINPQFVRHMEEAGIQCRVFNPIVPVVNFFMNHRDHRKITVIDGRVGFTGGYNLANEYFNINSPYGYWKDTGLRLEGEAVRTLTMLFLEMWSAMDKKPPEDPAPYLGASSLQGFTAREQGYAQPFGDTPLDEIQTGEDVYLNVLKNAKRYAYIMTPYLIITDDMSRELTLAAQRGVDVRIITPGIPDKKLIYQITRSYYGQLVRKGVRIYEFTPGFCHAKQIVSDGELAVVGTINFDYRSLYHHFENAVLLYGYSCIETIREDFERQFSVSREVTEKYAKGRSTALRIGQCILRLFAPLM